MTLFGPIRRAFKWALSGSTYDAVQAKNKRSAPIGILRTEDAELTPTDRRKMLSAARTLHRNFDRVVDDSQRPRLRFEFHLFLAPPIEIHLTGG
jgi:hypothetical protein